VAKEIKVKKTCCKDAPRCKRCPVVLKRLERIGAATRVAPRTYVLSADVRKRQIKAARR